MGVENGSKATSSGMRCAQTGNILAALAILVALGSAACDSDVAPAPSPSDAARDKAAQAFEKLDSAYFKESQVALAKGKTIAPDAFAQAMRAVADANHRFASGLVQIPLPDDARSDAKQLLDATVQIEIDALLEASSPGSTKIAGDFDVRNAADRGLRKDLHLDPKEVPK